MSDADAHELVESDFDRSVRWAEATSAGDARTTRTPGLPRGTSRGPMPVTSGVADLRP